MNEVIFTKETNGLGIIKLNRPNSLNALSYNMIQLISEQLKNWEFDNDIGLILFESAGDRAFCAGGDIKELYMAYKNDQLDGPIKYFLEDEYKLDLLIYNYPKPIIANMDGIIMGGGVGLVNGADFRVVTENTRWAMPETTIGFFTDVGAAYFMNKAPGYLGRYLALTGNFIIGKNVLHINAGDALIPQAKITQFFQKVKQTNWHTSHVNESLKTLVNEFDEQDEYEADICQIEEEINQHFQYETVEEIIESLNKSKTKFAKETIKTLMTKSPVSLKVTLKQQVDYANRSIADCLAIDTVLAANFLLFDDLYEGIRAVLIDRDNSPQYTYKTLEDVKLELVNSFFK